MKEFRIFFTALILSFVTISMFYQSLLLSIIIAGSLIFAFASFVVGLIQYFCVKVKLPAEDIVVSRLKTARYTLRITNLLPLSAAPVKIYGKFATECETNDTDRPVSHNREIFIATVGPNASIKPNWERVCRRRGEYRIGVSQIEMFDMLKLFCFRKRFGSMLNLVVLPRERVFPLNICGDHAEAKMVHNMQDGDDYSHVREYMNGDDSKAIHWKSTAKSDKIMIKQNEKNGGGDSAVFVSFEGADSVLADFVIEVALAAIKTILHTDGKTDVYFCGEIYYVQTLFDYDKLRRRFANLPTVPVDDAAFSLKIAESTRGAKYLITLTMTETKTKAAASARIILISETAVTSNEFITINPTETCS